MKLKAYEYDYTQSTHIHWFYLILLSYSLIRSINYISSKNIIDTLRVILIDKGRRIEYTVPQYCIDGDYVMPIYEYHCINCGDDFEKLVRFSDPNINTPECPGCHSENTHKRISKVAMFSGGSSFSSSASNCSSSGPFR